MFGKAELETLRLRKELLVLKSDMDRVLLVSESRRLGSSEYWLIKGASAARRHPVLTALLGWGVGLLAIQLLRRPAAAAGRLGWLGALSSMAIPLWKLLADRKRGE